MIKSFSRISCVLMAIAVLNSSCATIFGRSNYSVAINSNPVGSSITITDKKGVTVYQGNTPATVKLKSSSGYFAKGQYQVKFHMNGYEDRVVTLNSKLNGWYFGNILLGGLIGMLIIDPASGAMYKINDLAVNESLQQNTNTAQASELNIMDIHSVPTSALKNLERIN
ncbi:PEGA domain-containing protein [Mucilaginibacter lacusdianchii]|uniref:PEGA domain-containing protein n=1 Tax=Mucilaginibacter lacusdianchii TaxID=2684211 RepID=UPI00131AAF5D|nr:PEGA domain-containing protein [Mucilaginibacter sp. JXJ CY 39]